MGGLIKADPFPPTDLIRSEAVRAADVKKDNVNDTDPVAREHPLGNS